MTLEERYEGFYNCNQKTSQYEQHEVFPLGQLEYYERWVKGPKKFTKDFISLMKKEKKS